MEIWLQIISELRKYEFIPLSSTSHFFRKLSLPILFHTIRFAAIGDPPTAQRLLEMKSWASVGVLENIVEIQFTRTKYVAASHDQPDVLAILRSMPKLRTVSLGMGSASNANLLHILRHPTLHKLMLKGTSYVRGMPMISRLPKRSKLVHLILNDIKPSLWVQNFLSEIAPQLETLEISFLPSEHPIHGHFLIPPISSALHSSSHDVKSCPHLRSFTFQSPYSLPRAWDNNLYTFLSTHPEIKYLSLLNVLHPAACGHLPRLSLPNLVELATNLPLENTTDQSPLFGNLNRVRKLYLKDVVGLGTSLPRLEDLLAKSCAGVEQMHLTLDPTCNTEDLFSVLARSSRRLRVLQLDVSNRARPMGSHRVSNGQGETEVSNPFLSFPTVDSEDADTFGKPSPPAHIPRLPCLQRITVDVTMQGPDYKLAYGLIFAWFDMLLRPGCPALHTVEVDAWQESQDGEREMNAGLCAPEWWIKWWRVGDGDDWREEQSTGKIEGLSN